MKKLLALVLCLLLCCAAALADEVPEDGVYLARFDTDGSMFHVNEMCDGRGTLTVEGGVMTIHLVMPSKNTVMLFAGLAEDAKAEGAALIEPTVESVTYSDGWTEEVYAFDVPVPVLGEPFDCALIGKKGKWYDHKVTVSDPIPVPAVEKNCEVTLSGGSGRAHVESPAVLTACEDGSWMARIVWSSPNYEYMLVDGVRYEREPGEGNSAFVIPVVLDEDMAVSACTVAMSEPHLIDYTLRFDGATLQ